MIKLLDQILLFYITCMFLKTTLTVYMYIAGDCESIFNTVSEWEGKGAYPH